MARLSGSLCSEEAKDVSAELSQLSGLPYRQNLDYLRFIEKLVVYRIAEQVRENSHGNDLPEVTVEIPLIGNLTIKPIVFHKAHRLTDKPSLHFEYVFEPLSGFKKGILSAFLNKESDLPTEFAQKYGEKLSKLYEED